jgi:hypothetical protein
MGKDLLLHLEAQEAGNFILNVEFLIQKRVIKLSCFLALENFAMITE